MYLKCGWDGWTRTSGCGSQSPVPYHLATPQYVGRRYRPYSPSMRDVQQKLEWSWTYRMRSSGDADSIAGHGGELQRRRNNSTELVASQLGSRLCRSKESYPLRNELLSCCVTRFTTRYAAGDSHQTVTLAIC